MRLLIFLRGLYLATHGATVGDFKHAAKYDAHLLDGEPLSPAQFNALIDSPRWDRLLEHHGPRLRIRCLPRSDGANRKQPLE